MPYLDAVDGAFGIDMDYAQLVKIYGEAPTPPGCYSRGVCTGTQKRTVQGRPDVNHVSTSYVERQNLTMGMQMRRFTRLTNDFSKKALPHCHMVALYTVWYNFLKKHKTIRSGPAMAAGVSSRLWSMEDMVALIDAREVPAGKGGPYKPRAAKASNSN